VFTGTLIGPGGSCILPSGCSYGVIILRRVVADLD
jgi:hypothetical protein